MRVTHVITRLVVGGAQENTIASVLGLRDRSTFRADLISGPTQGPEGSLENRFDHAPGVLRIVPELVRPINPVKDWRALRQLTAILRADRPDIVHTHSGKAGILGRIAAYRAGVPIIIHTIHGPSFGNFQGTLANAVLRQAERYAARMTTHFVVVAEAMAQQYLAAGIGKTDDYTKIASGFDLQPFLRAQDDSTLRNRLGIRSDDFVIGKIARLFRLKGHDDLFAAAPAIVKQWPSTKFLLVGDGAWRERFERQTEKLGLREHFIFTGLVPPSDVPRLIGLMDAVVHLSRREGLPRALPQAMAASKPVIAYDCDGAGEVCLEGATGFLLKAGDLHGLADRLLLLSRDPKLRRQLGHRGRRLVESQFSVEKMVDDLAGLYQRLAEDRLIAVQGTCDAKPGVRSSR